MTIPILSNENCRMWSLETSQTVGAEGSADPDLGDPYRRRVVIDWTHRGRPEPATGGFQGEPMEVWGCVVKTSGIP